MPAQNDEFPVVARTGRWSIFAALQECCPSAVRNDDPYIGKYGMTEIELNKVLERNSFIKIRDRSSCGAGAGEDEVRVHISRVLYFVNLVWTCRSVLIEMPHPRPARRARCATSSQTDDG